MTKTELTQQYIEKYIEIAKRDNKGFSKRFIATNLHAENSTVFKDVEDARFMVRSLLGSRGRKLKKYQDLEDAFCLMADPVRETDNPEPFIVPTSIKKTLWIADVHVPFYNKEALKIAIKKGMDQKCDSVIILGDFMDFYSNSKFDKSPLTSIKCFNDMEDGQEMLRMLQNTFGTVILKQGNHDKRREDKINLLSATMPELAEIAGSYKEYLFFDGCRVDFVEDYRHIDYGKLSAFHGHEYYGGGGIHVAYNRFNKALDNIITAHSHKAQSIIKKDIHDNIFGSWCLGCLCQLSPRYSPKNDWNNGFAITEKDSSGNFEVDNKVIYGDKTFSV